MERYYIVSYDISDTRRWRMLYRKMKGYGQWLQLSVFQCRLNKMGLLQMQNEISNIIHHEEDHVLIIDLGPADSVHIKVQSLGKQFEPIEKKSIIV